MAVANDEVLLQRLVGELTAVAGVAAIALGGSRARGTATAHSDYDIGLYYDPADPIDVEALAAVAARLDDRGDKVAVTALGGWGPWINGGGWLTVGGDAVDLLYRDLELVAVSIEDAHGGRISRHYQPGHPHAFLPTIYMGEVALARVLHDPSGALTLLRRRCHPYPATLAGALEATFGWEAGFALANGRKALGRNDVSYIGGCIFRAVSCLCQVWFARNGVYLLNEKGAVAAIDGFARRPDQFASRVAELYRLLGVGLSARALDELETLVAASG